LSSMFAHAESAREYAKPLPATAERELIRKSRRSVIIGFGRSILEVKGRIGGGGTCSRTEIPLTHHRRIVFGP
jgi:hypothetical protein